MVELWQRFSHHVLIFIKGVIFCLMNVKIQPNTDTDSFFVCFAFSKLFHLFEKRLHENRLKIDWKWYPVYCVWFLESYRRHHSDWTKYKNKKIMGQFVVFDDLLLRTTTAYGVKLACPCKMRITIETSLHQTIPKCLTLEELFDTWPETLAPSLSLCISLYWNYFTMSKRGKKILQKS